MKFRNNYDSTNWSGLQIPPTLPEHHEVQDRTAYGDRLQVRPDALDGRVWPRGGLGGCRPGREGQRKSQDQRVKAWKDISVMQSN